MTADTKAPEAPDQFQALRDALEHAAGFREIRSEAYREACARVAYLSDKDAPALLDEVDRLRALATCGCGDQFTEHDPGTCGNCVAGKDQTAEVERLRAALTLAQVDAERLRIRGATYEEAYGIALQATYQSHNGHWDSTMRGGLGCPECIRAREARENCDAAIRRGLEQLPESAAARSTK